MNGTNYNDTYLFNLGDGQERRGNLDLLSFTSGITKDDLWFYQNEQDLIIKVAGQNDKVTISNWYDSSSKRVENITVASGDVLHSNQVDQLVSAMAAFTSSGSGQMDILPSTYDELLPAIAASWQSA